MDKWLETKQFPTSLVSASGFVLKDNKVLMIKHKERGWSFPGGVSDQGEPILDCLKREIIEESGITIKVNKLFGVYQRLKTKPGYGPLEGAQLPPVIVLTFLCDYVEGKEVISDESEDVSWFTIEQAKELVIEPFTRLTFNDFINYKGDVLFNSFNYIEDLNNSFL